MKILVLSSSFPRYEGDYFGPFILEYVRELVRQGHEVILTAPNAADTDPSILTKEKLIIERFNYFYPRSWQKLVYPPGIIPQLKANVLRYIQIPFMLLAYRNKVFQLIKKHQPDIIHSQWVIPSGYIGSLAAKKFKLPHVITSQGAEFFLPINHPFSKFTKKTLQKCDYLFPVSNQMGQRALKYGITKEKVVTISNAVNTDIFHPNISSDFRAKHGIEDDEIVILTIRRLVFEKRVDDVIVAFAKMKSKKKVRLIIGGDGPEKDKLKKLCVKLGIMDKVVFLGFINNNQLPPIYSACDIYILSSQQEGLSLSLLEAMSSGLATITTKSTGGTEVISNEVNGFLYDVGNVDQLSEILAICLCKDRLSLEEIKHLARNEILLKYSVMAMVNNWIKFYEKLLFL